MFPHAARPLVPSAASFDFFSRTEEELEAAGVEHGGGLLAIHGGGHEGERAVGVPGSGSPPAAMPGMAAAEATSRAMDKLAEATSMSTCKPAMDKLADATTMPPMDKLAAAMVPATGADSPAARALHTESLITESILRATLATSCALGL